MLFRSDLNHDLNTNNSIQLCLPDFLMPGQVTSQDDKTEIKYDTAFVQKIKRLM